MAMLVQWHQEHLVGKQEAQDLPAVMGVANGVAQFAAKAFLGCRVVEERLDLGRQAIDDFFEQIIADQPFPAVQRLRQRAIGACLRGGQQPEAQPRDPAFAALDQVFQCLTAQGAAVPVEQAQGFVVGQAQILFMQLK